jgi:hypothetical protein
MLERVVDGMRRDVRRVGTVGKDDIDVWRLESLQRTLQSLDDVLLRQASGVWLFAAGSKEDLNSSAMLSYHFAAQSYLGGQDIFISRPIEFLESSAHFNFGLATGVRLGSIEEIDTMVPGSLEAFLDYVSL